MNRYLITYGAENEMFTCEADNCVHAAEQFISWEGVSPDPDENADAINEIALLVPVLRSDVVGAHSSVTEYAGLAGDGTFFAANDLRVLVIEDDFWPDQDPTTEIEQMFKELS